MGHFIHDENNKAIDNIVDCFNDAPRFIKFKFGMEHFEKEGSEVSDKIMEIMRRFSRLIDVFDKEVLQDGMSREM